jgi:leucyl aminopeptidase
MKYSAQTGTLTDSKTGIAMVSLADANKLARSLKQQALVTAAVRDFKDQAGETLTVQLEAGGAVDRLLVVGGCDGTLSLTDFRKSATAAANALKNTQARTALCALAGTKVDDADLAARIRTLLSAISIASYRYDSYKSGKAPTAALRTVSVLTDKRGEKTTRAAVREANALKQGFDLARDLGNEPPNVCHPSYLLAQARKLGKADKVKVSALDEKKMTELGMGAFMSVSRGSEQPGKMIIIEYKGGKRGDAPIALVGKGITFDTGGISLKPGPGMDEMKFDMCGAASVLGATKAIIEAKLPINLVTMVAAAENMPSGRASRPGDIVSTMSGQTVEILNTDAEGRLVLCDALTYVQRFKPSAVVDVATLTGAIIIALGSHASGLYANDDELAADLLAAGQRTGDRAWHMPLWDDYQKQLKSNFADMANIGGREAGSVTAACFLARFAKDISWAHLDVAGSAFQGGAAKGATGRPVGLLFDFVRERAGK